jgi:cation diffusion facilitator family transporter
LDRYSQANRVSILGILANAFLFIIKIIIGIISRSQGMIADGLNSASDIVSSVMTFTGNRIARKPRDKDHPYGHGKAEYIFSMFISIIMLAVAAVIFRSSLLSILQKELMTFSVWIVVVCAVTIIVKLSLYLYSRKIGREYNNLLVSANALDHRNDMFLTTATLIGVIGSRFGVYWLDGVVGLGIAVWIFGSAMQIFVSAFRVLMDSDVDTSLKDDISAFVKNCAGVGHIDSIIAKPVGVTFLIVLKISVDGDMTVQKSHELSGLIKHTLLRDNRIADVVVHVNPLEEGEKKMNLFIGEKYFDFITALGSAERGVAPDEAGKIIITCDCGEAVEAVKIAREKKIPLLAIMDGYSAVVKAFGGAEREIDAHSGEQEFSVIDATSPMYVHLESVIKVCRGTNRAICEDNIPADIDCMSRAETGEIIALRNWEEPKKYGNIYALNFDLSSEKTPDGKQIVRNFFAI